MPSRSQIRPNSNGPPMRLAATDNDTVAVFIERRDEQHLVSELGAGGEQRRQSAGRDEVIGAPRLAMTDWRTAPSKRLFSTTWR